MARELNNCDLAEALNGIAGGDGEALRRLYEATANELYAICLAEVQNREVAEDVLHEVYIKVWNRAAECDPNKGSPMVWLSFIARKSTIDCASARGDPDQTYLRSAYLRGLTYFQVAEEADVPLGIVKTRIRRELTLLRAQMPRDHRWQQSTA